MPRATQDPARSHRSFAYWAITIYGQTFQNGFARVMRSMLQSYNPTVAGTTMVWAVPRSLATT